VETGIFAFQGVLSLAEDPRITLALKRFKLAVEARAEQCARELEDLAFARGRQEDQWPAEAIAERTGRIEGIDVIAPRPILTINKLKQPLDQLENQAKASRLSIHFSADSDDADPEVAELYEDIARAIQVDSRAHIARNWGFRRSIRAGRGFYRIVVDYANDDDDDLDIIYKRILNQSSVHLDPFAQEPDASDMGWGFITDDRQFDSYKSEYPDSELAGYDDDALVGLGDDAAGWVGGDEAGRTVRIAEYFEVEIANRKRVLHPERGWMDLADLSADERAALPKDAKKRTVKDRTVWHRVINCLEVLEETEWNGRYVPIITIPADEDVVGSERSWQGVVRPARDAQRSYNVMRSAEMEAIGLAPKAPYVGYEGQFDGHEAKWDTANVRNWPYLEARPVTVDGKPAPLPQRNVQEPAIQAIALSSRQASDDIHATTGVPPVALGQLDPHERSGKAIAALQQVSEQGTAGYLDNLASISMLYEGKVLRDLIPKVYDRPGRVVHAMGADDQRRTVMVNAPFVQQPGGRPQMAPEGTQGAKHYDLSKGQYSVSVKVGKSYTTKREQGAAALGELIQAAPELIGVLGDLYVGELDGPSMRQAADRLKKMAEKQGLIESDEGEQGIPQLKAQLAKAQEVLQLLTQELQVKNEFIQTEQVKAQQAVGLEQARQVTEIERIHADERMKNRELEVKLEIEMSKLGSAQAMKRAEFEQEQLHAHGEQQLEREKLEAGQAQADMDRQASREEAAADRDLSQQQTAAQGKDA
jgi:hypothetical protein